MDKHDTQTRYSTTSGIRIVPRQHLLSTAARAEYASRCTRVHKEHGVLLAKKKIASGFAASSTRQNPPTVRTANDSRERPYGGLIDMMGLTFVEKAHQSVGHC